MLLNVGRKQYNRCSYGNGVTVASFTYGKAGRVNLMGGTYMLTNSGGGNSGQGTPLSGNQLERKVDAFKVRCRQTGLKVTPQRVAVYKMLIESKEHPSAEVLWRKMRKTFPRISLDTVNRTLLTLAEIGAAFIVEGSGDVKRFDGCLENHQHFKCVQCKRIIDFRHKPFDTISIPKSIGAKYAVLKKTVYLEGICDLCKKRSHRRREGRQ